MSNTPSQSRQKKKTWLQRNWWIFLALGLCFLTQLPLFFQPLSQTEAIQIMAVASKPFDLYHYQPQQLSYEPPGIYYLLKSSSKISKTNQFTDTTSIAQASSQIFTYNLLIIIIPNLLTLFGFYLLATKFLKRKTSSLLSFILALLPLPLVFIQVLTLSPLYWTLTWTIWSWLFLLEMLGVGRDVVSVPRSSALGKFLRRIPFGYNYLFFFAFTIAGIYTSYAYFACLIVQLITMGIYKRWKRVLLTIILVLIAYVPWIPFIYRQQQIIPAYRETLEDINL